jgi:hypothetical protein
LTLIADYSPIADDRYLDDPRAGATIDSTAIRSVLQRVLTDGESAFHVHRHEHTGIPWPSRTDRRTIHELSRSFLAAAPDVVHGGIVVSLDSASALGYTDRDAPPLRGYVSIIGDRSVIKMGFDEF